MISTQHNHIKKKKRFGQHFLNDELILQRIAQHIAPQKTDHIIEIGPGAGALTQHLIDRCASLTLIEIDRDLAEKCRRETADKAHVQVIECDALTFDWSSLDTDHSWRIVGNLPYNISTPLIFKCLAVGAGFRDMHFVLQKEVVDRLAAQPNSRDYGRLSVMAQYHCQTRKSMHIPPIAFSPPPKVNSALVALKPFTTRPAEADNHKHFATLVRDAFNHRRKTIANAIKSHVTREQIIAAEIDPKRRPETLSVAEFVRLSNLMTADRS